MGARSGRLTASRRMMAVEVATINRAQAPDILPPAITVSQEVAELCLAEDLAVYGASGPAALAWQWALTGQGPTPVSLREWHVGPPDHDTMLDESRWPYGDGWQGHAQRAEIDKARFLLWWLTASPDEETPARFNRLPVARHIVAEPGPTVTLVQVHCPNPRHDGL